MKNKPGCWRFCLSFVYYVCTLRPGSVRSLHLWHSRYGRCWHHVWLQEELLRDRRRRPPLSLHHRSRARWAAAVRCAVPPQRVSPGLCQLSCIYPTTGHVFNMPHDNVKACADVFGKLQDNHMMSPTLIQINRTSPWSPCSAAIVTEFLDSGHGEFLWPLTCPFDCTQTCGVIEKAWGQSQGRHELLSAVNSINMTNQSFSTTSLSFFVE